jgi:hypothetical protein
MTRFDKDILRFPDIDKPFVRDILRIAGAGRVKGRSIAKSGKDIIKSPPGIPGGLFSHGGQT